MDDADPPTSSWNDSTKTTVAVLIALIVVLMVAGIGVATVRDAADTIRQATSTTSSTVPSPGAAAPGGDVPPEQARVVEEAQAQVAAIRGLEWREQLPVRFLSKEELARRIRELNAEEIAEKREELSADESVLKLLQLIPDDVDLAEVLDDILAGGVLGYYDDETKELFVGVGESGTFDAPTRSVLVHELVHALTDQHFDFGPRTKALDDEDRTEEGFAFSALLEGDASLVQSLWAERHLTAGERLQAALGSPADANVYAAAPPYLLESLLFPYRDGLDFVTALHRAGGFPAVDEAYRRPPTSAEHILHPETYTAGQSWAAPDLPDLASATGCGRVDSGTLGEFDMSQMLARHISRRDARAAAQGWDGDAYGVVRCGASLGFAGRWDAENGVEAAELARALERWAPGWSGSTRGAGADGRFSGSKGAARVLHGGSRVELVLADDAATADRLAGVIAGG